MTIPAVAKIIIARPLERTPQIWRNFLGAEAGEFRCAHSLGGYSTFLTSARNFCPRPARKWDPQGPVDPVEYFAAVQQVVSGVGEDGEGETVHWPA